MSVTLKLTDILSESFFKQTTSFENFTDFLQKAGVSIQSADDYHSLEENESLNKFIQDNTTYISFTDLKGKAAAYYVRNKLLGN
ncbi:hypothetical protein [Acinetobacter sp. NIPH 817]|uniref:hypothetical protein n=1 Tax=Acinetobacter sp. NIPH 817 TaxID=520708 RepID=UPI0002CF993B|nr:hypothetical protein [Acinetobacter sp. NIPH 817]ENV01918.1 hypothetical protein F968_02504 [Acinetobacter sp. NIPH 817]